MNKHIKLVEKWLSDKDSVTQEELKQNKKDADAAYAAYLDVDIRKEKWDFIEQLFVKHFYGESKR
jgi:hypothetical protein